MKISSPAVLVVLMTVVLDAVGIGLMMPVMPALMEDLGANSLGRAAIWGTALSALFALMQFSFGPTIGNLSDRFGRRFVLLASLFVAMVDYVLHALAWSLTVLVIARIIAGIAGATQSTASAFMADISKPHEKSANFGLIGAAFGIGFILGPLLGGIIGNQFGPRAPFWAAAAMAGLNFTIGYFVLHETVTPEKRRAFDWRRANPFGAFKQIRKLPEVSHFLVVLFIYQIGFMVYPAIWSYYTIERYGWTASTVGFSLASFGLMIAIVQGGLIRVFLAKLGEYKTALMGLSLNAVAFMLMGIAWEGWMVFAIIILTTFGAVTTPSLQGQMSQRVADDAQGELQGIFTSVGAIAAIISPLAMGPLFGYFTSEQAPFYLPGAPFFVCGILTIFAVIVYLRPTRKQNA